MRDADRVVLIFGLAGSGKSSLAIRLAEEFRLRKIHPSGIMRDLLEGKTVQPEVSRANDGFWETAAGAAILQERLDQDEPVDVRANEILLEEVAKGNVVIDTWSLPWLTDKGVRLHLVAPLAVRAARAARRAQISNSQAEQLIDRKDKDTRELFLRLYDFDIDSDHEVFDLTIDTTELTTEQVFDRASHFLRKLWLEERPGPDNREP